MIANALSRDSPPSTPSRRPDNRLSVTVSNKQANKSGKTGRLLPQAALCSATGLNSWSTPQTLSLMREKQSLTYVCTYSKKCAKSKNVILLVVKLSTLTPPPSRNPACRRGERRTDSEAAARYCRDGRQVHRQHAQRHYGAHTPHPGPAGEER